MLTVMNSSIAGDAGVSVLLSNIVRKLCNSCALNEVHSIIPLLPSYARDSFYRVFCTDIRMNCFHLNLLALIVAQSFIILKKRQKKTKDINLLILSCVPVYLVNINSLVQVCTSICLILYLTIS